MKIATFNINGIKARLDALLDWLDEAKPDVACLQETKKVDAEFPRAEFERLGYQVELHGMKSFNGVAILSKLPITTQAGRVEWEGPPIIEATLGAEAGGLTPQGVGQERRLLVERPEKRVLLVVLTSDRVMYRGGILQKQSIEIPLERINTVFCHQGLFERMLRLGDLEIESASKDGAQVFDDIRRPSDVQKEIYVQMEANENRK